MIKNKYFIASFLIMSSATVLAFTANKQQNVDDRIIAEQRSTLAKNSEGKGFGPQSPRDIDSLKGENNRIFGKAPHYSQMNLCNIHFHKNAEHKGGEFTQYAGNGDGKGYNSGYRYSGRLSSDELKPFKLKNSEHMDLQSGDTIELHYVYSTAAVAPGATLGACLHDPIGNPQLRVEAQVFVLVNNDEALDFTKLVEHSQVNGYHQAVNIPNNTGRPIEYAGSTTGPSYNEKASPFQVTWSVRPKAAKVTISSVYKWLEKNDFDENHAHGVRNLVINPKLLSSAH